jgi:hypothetical protein
MDLFLKADLIKGSPGEDRGSAKGGKYAARIQEGYEKDGSPKYKYFATLEDRDKYLKNKSRDSAEKKEGSKQLSEKLASERQKARKRLKTSDGKQKVGSGGLFVGDNKAKNKKKKMAKSLNSIFIWSFDD